MASLNFAKDLGFSIAGAGIYTIANNDYFHPTTNPLFASLNDPKKIKFIVEKSTKIRALFENKAVSGALRDVNAHALELRDLQDSGASPADRAADEEFWNNILKASVSYAAEILDEHVRGKFVY